MQIPNGSKPPDTIDRVSALLAEILGLAAAAQPEALARACSLHPECAAALRAAYGQLQRMDLLQVGQPENAGLASGAHPDAAPRVLGPFRLLEPLGSGGMGTVYRAEDEELKRPVALKLVRGELLVSGRTRSRFQREAAALARLDHPGLCTVYRSGVTDGQPWIAMRLVRGTTLAQGIEARRRDTGTTKAPGSGRRDSSHARRELRHTVALFEKIARALATAHAVGVIHRDLKPGNIVLTDDGEPVVIDFGLVHLEDSDSHLTISGDHIGTPAYMAPEQVEPAGREPAPTTDVYALGVTLFEALTLELPYSAHSREELFHCIVRGRRRRLRQVRKELPADLELVLEKALELEPERRYTGMIEFADDLRRYLAHEPLTAGPPSAWYRLRKLVRRYPGQVAAGSAVLLTAVVGAVVALQFALGEQAKVREFDLLSALPQHDRLIAAEATLYPPWPDQVAPMERWQEDARRLLAMKPEIEQTVHDLKARALPWTPAQQAADRQAHPDLAEYEVLTRQLASLRYAQAIRDGQQTLVVSELSAEQLALDEQAMNERCMSRVAQPGIERASGVKRWIYGEEPLGLAYARAALAKTAGSEFDYQYRLWLAWALVANGQDAEGAQESEEAARLAPAEQAGDYRAMHEEVVAAATKRGEHIADAERRIVALEAALGQRRTYRFELDSTQFLHDTLMDVLGKLEALTRREREVDRRLGWSRRIGALSLAHPGARHSWAEARAAIAAADGVVASKLYAGKAIELRDPDVVGLVPIGRNPATGLWEFYDLRSAWDGEADPVTLTIPSHEPDGRIQVTEATGMVFVLLPGGTFTMGAQGEDPAGANFDREANRDDETVHSVTLAPFFLSKYELTQGQWLRTWDGVDARRQPSQYKVGHRGSATPVTLAHPVESVTWTECDRLLQQCGLVLPTEAQWEYAARAGTTTPWSTGEEAKDLQGFANVLDRTGVGAMPQWERWGAAEAFEDGFVIHAPVGSFGANGFGLYDVHGNVWEWCRDSYGSYAGPTRVGDGFRLHDFGARMPCLRGGGFVFPARGARSALRNHNAPGFASDDVGLRPARALRRPE